MNSPSSSPRQRPNEEVADRLHSAAIHLLRRVRVYDAESGLTPSRLSALSVIVFAGPIRVGDLATAEQVRPPTISRLVKELEAAGLVRRVPDLQDGRVQRIEATERGYGILQEGRRRRVEALANGIAELSQQDRSVLDRATAILERLALPSDHPQHGE